jgi:hypothetical protein
MRKWDGVADLATQGGDGLGGIFAAIGLAIAIVVLLIFVVPLLVALVEVLVLGLLAAIAIGARILFRRPWTVEAVADDGALRTRRIVGWRASGEHERRFADEIRLGEWVAGGDDDPHQAADAGSED